MRTLNISISDIEFNKFGIRKDSLTFTEFVELVSRELMRQNLNKCVELAEKYGLSSYDNGRDKRRSKSGEKCKKSSLIPMLLFLRLSNGVRIGTAEDIANIVEFLLPTKASWITGQIMHVDGGMSSLKI